MIDHDRLFKELLATFFIEFVDLFLPDVAGYLDRSSIVFLDKEIFTDVTGGDRHEVDLIVKARFKGSESFFLVHVEAQAQRRGEFGRRMFCYFSRLFEKYGLPVYPVVVFSFESPRRKQPASFEVRFPGMCVVRFRYAVLQLNRLDWRSYLSNPNPVAAALMSRMGIAAKDRPHVKLECWRMLLTLKLDPARAKMIAEFFETYLQLTADEMKVFEIGFDAMDKPEKEKYMEIVTSWEEQGIKKGIKKGIEQGIEKGRRSEAEALIMRQLARRLGEIDPGFVQQVTSLSLERLENLSEDLLDFSSMADLKQWLRDNC